MLIFELPGKRANRLLKLQGFLYIHAKKRNVLNDLAFGGAYYPLFFKAVSLR
jgi:hypothetical protein